MTKTTRALWEMGYEDARKDARNDHWNPKKTSASYRDGYNTGHREHHAATNPPSDFLAEKRAASLRAAVTCSRCGSHDNPRPLAAKFACNTCGDCKLCYACDVTHGVWCSG